MSVMHGWRHACASPASPVPQVDPFRARVAAVVSYVDAQPSLRHPPAFEDESEEEVEPEEDVEAAQAAIPVDIFFSQQRRQVALQAALSRREELKKLHLRLAEESRLAAGDGRKASRRRSSRSAAFSRGNTVTVRDQAAVKAALARDVARLEAKVKAKQEELVRDMEAALRGVFGSRLPAEVTTFMQVHDDPASILTTRHHVSTKRV